MNSLLSFMVYKLGQYALVKTEHPWGPMWFPSYYQEYYLHRDINYNFTHCAFLKWEHPLGPILFLPYRLMHFYRDISRSSWANRLWPSINILLHQYYSNLDVKLFIYINVFISNWAMMIYSDNSILCHEYCCAPYVDITVLRFISFRLGLSSLLKF